MKKYKKRALLSLLIHIGILLLLLAALFLFPFSVHIVRGNDMYPSLKDGELILISKAARKMNDSVVLYRTEGGKEKFGRISASEGDLIEHEEEELLINGIGEEQIVPFPTPPGSLAYPYRVPERSYFILNDYREANGDSRDSGAVPEEQVEGVVIFSLRHRGF